MYLHIGNDRVVNTRHVVGIFDMENTTVNKLGRKFLAAAQKRGDVENIADDLPRTYVVVSHDGKTKVYISSISAQTLLKRSKSSKIIIE